MATPAINPIANLITQVVDAWNDHDLDQVAELYAPDFEGMDVAQAAVQKGWEGVRQSMTRYNQAFPDLHFTPESLVIEGAQAALFWAAQGTHQGRLMNIPPTGHPVQVRGVSLFTISEGKIKRVSHIWDVAGLLRGIGLLPEL